MKHPLGIAAVVGGLLLLPVLTPSSAAAQSSRDWCSGMRVPTDAKETEARCAMLKAASAYLEKLGVLMPSDHQLEQALRAGGIDPKQEASCWGLPWGTLGNVFSAPDHLTLYRSELGCQRETQPLQLNSDRHDTRWQVESRDTCSVRISSDWDTFVSVEIDAGRAALSVTIITGTDGVTPQTIVVDDKVFTSNKPQYAITGQDAEDGLRAMLKGQFVKNVPYDRSVRLGDFAEIVEREIQRMSGCPGVPARLLN
jgi:hypothetical protein